MGNILITGFSGQDGAYLLKHLVQTKFQGTVVGVSDRSNPWTNYQILAAYYGLDLPQFKVYIVSKEACLARVFNEYDITDIYHFGFYSHARGNLWGFYTSSVNYSLKLLSAMEGREAPYRLFFASTTNLLGPNLDVFKELRESNPYLLAKGFLSKVFVQSRREGWKIVVGFLSNHESILRPDTFVFRKLSKRFAKLVLGIDSKLELHAPKGDLSKVVCSWAYAGDFVRAIHGLTMNSAGGEFLISGDECVSLKMLYEEFVDAAGLTGSPPTIIPVQSSTSYFNTEPLRLTQKIVGKVNRKPFPTLVRELLEYDVELLQRGI